MIVFVETLIKLKLFFGGLKKSLQFMVMLTCFLRSYITGDLNSETRSCDEDSLAPCVCIRVLPLCSHALRELISGGPGLTHTGTPAAQWWCHWVYCWPAWGSLFRVRPSSGGFASPQGRSAVMENQWNKQRGPSSPVLRVEEMRLFCLDVDHLSPNWICLNNPSALLHVFQVHQEKSSWLSLLDLSLLFQDRLSPSGVKPVLALVTTFTGTYRNQKNLPNFWFITLQVVSQGSQIVSVEVDLEVTSLWPSEEFWLKMQEIIIVSRVTAPRSHSETTSYKNLLSWRGTDPLNSCTGTQTLYVWVTLHRF